MTVGFPPALGNIIYEYDYFAGSQCIVYFEDVLVDDIVRIAWGVTQNRQPIYGYASQYWSAVAAGTVIGAGSFWTAYKEAAYIPIILQHISSNRDPADQFFSTPALLPFSGGVAALPLTESASVWESNTQDGGARMAGRVSRRNDIQRLMQTADANPDDATAQSEMTQYAINVMALPDRAFEDAAEFFEDAVWYGGNRDMAGGRNAVASGNWGGGEMTEEQAIATRRADQYPPFDILVTFGDINNPAANHTVQRLMNTIITDTKFINIETSGEPIIVQYDFIFRSMM